MKRATNLIDGFRHNFRQRRGSMLAIVGLSFLGLMGAAGLAVDVGYWYWQRVLLQQAADAGALAGAQDIKNQNLSVAGAQYNKTKARTYIAHNGINTATEIEDIAYTPAAGASQARVTVILKRDVGTFFLSVFGARTIPIRARAVAEASNTVTGFTGTLGNRTAIDFAVYAGDPSSQLRIAGGGKIINGDAHGNGSIEAKLGNNQTINGDLTGGNYVDHDPSKVAVSGIVDDYVAQVTSDIVPVDQIKEYANFTHLSGFEVNSQIADGVYYVEGDLNINFNIQGHVSFVVTGEIHLNSHIGTINANNNGIGLVSLSASDKAIQANANGGVINAFLLAPNGGIRGSGNGWTVYGGVAGKDVDISGQDVTISYGASHAEAIPTTPSYGAFVHLVE